MYENSQDLLGEGNILVHTGSGLSQRSVRHLFVSCAALFAKLETAALEEFNRFVVPYWDRDARGFISDKVKQQKEYEGRLRSMFAAAEPGL